MTFSNYHFFENSLKHFEKPKSIKLFDPLKSEENLIKAPNLVCRCGMDSSAIEQCCPQALASGAKNLALIRPKGPYRYMALSICKGPILTSIRKILTLSRCFNIEYWKIILNKLIEIEYINLSISWSPLQVGQGELPRKLKT